MAPPSPISILLTVGYPTEERASEQARNAALTSAPLVSPFKSDLFLSRDKSKLSLRSVNISSRRTPKKTPMAGKVGRNLVIARSS